MCEGLSELILTWTWLYQGPYSLRPQGMAKLSPLGEAQRDGEACLWGLSRNVNSVC